MGDESVAGGSMLGKLFGWVRNRFSGAAASTSDAAPASGGAADAADNSPHGKCVSWAALGYCSAGAHQQYMSSHCVTECEEGRAAGSLPEPGQLWQAAEIDCLAWRLADACNSHAEYMCAPAARANQRAPAIYIYIYMYVYIFTFAQTYIYTHICIYMYINRQLTKRLCNPIHQFTLAALTFTLIEVSVIKRRC